MRKKFFTVRATEHCNRLSTTSRPSLDAFLCKPLHGTSFSTGVRQDDLQRSPPIPLILRVHNSTITGLRRTALEKELTECVCNPHLQKGWESPIPCPRAKTGPWQLSSEGHEMCQLESYTLAKPQQARIEMKDGVAGTLFQAEKRSNNIGHLDFTQSIVECFY